MKIIHTIRSSSGYSKAYINHLLEEFSPKWVEKYETLFPQNEIKAIHFCIQDFRGVPSITLIDKRHCVPHQIHFKNYNLMLGFIEGFLAATNNHIY